MRMDKYNPSFLAALNIYAPNNIVSCYIRQVTLNAQRKLDWSTIIMEEFNTPLSG